MGRDMRIAIAAQQFYEFQPTRPHGTRLSYFIGSVLKQEISTHAPAWDATDYHTKGKSVPDNFNPRARMGRDHT